MNDREDLLKKILLHMKYDSKNTLSENKNNLKPLLTEKCIPLNTVLTDRKNKGNYRSDKYKELGKWGDGRCPCKDSQCLEFNENCCKPVLYGKNEPASGSIDAALYKDNTPIVVQTAGIGKYLTIPRGVYEDVTFVDWVDKNTPYYEPSAKFMFGKYCLFLSGEYPGYPAGYNGERDYFIDDKGNRCKSKVIKVETINTVHSPKYTDYKRVGNQISGQGYQTDELTNKYYYSEKGKNKWVEAKGKDLENIKTKVDFDTVQAGISPKFLDVYDDGCKPLPLDVCLKWSWASLYNFGAADKGLKEFSFKKWSYDENNEKVYEPEVTYKTCWRAESYYKPWTARYSGDFYRKDKIGDPVYMKALNSEVSGGCPGAAKFKQIPDIYLGGGLSSEPYNVATLDDSTREEIVNKTVNAYKKETLEKGVKRMDRKIWEFETAKIGMVAASGLRLQGK